MVVSLVIPLVSVIEAVTHESLFAEITCVGRENVKLFLRVGFNENIMHKCTWS